MWKRSNSWRIIMWIVNIICFWLISLSIALNIVLKESGRIRSILMEWSDPFTRSVDVITRLIPLEIVAFLISFIYLIVSAGHRKRIFETIGITYDTSNEKIERAVKIIEEILESHDEISKDYIVNLHELGDSSINIRVNAYVKTKVFNKYLKVKEAFLMELIKKFREENIEFAFPSQTVYLAGSNNEN